MTEAGKGLQPPQQPPQQPEVLEDGDSRKGLDVGEAIEQPAKVMRLGAMLRNLLEEVRAAPLDGRSRDRLREIYETSLSELSSALSPDLQDELSRLALPFNEASLPTAAELRIAKAQVVGWLEGLVQGIQATLYAQQVIARRQLADMRGQLPSPKNPDPAAQDEDSGYSGAYL